MYITNIVNSFIGKYGNIGLRTLYIIKELNSQNIDNFSYSRGIIKNIFIKNKNMGIFGQIPRILNAYRIYVNLWFNHRKYDIYLFEKFFNLVFNIQNNKNNIAHIWEISPNIINKLNKLNYITILDIPIAPTNTSINLMHLYKDVQLHSHKHIYNLELKSYKLVDYIIAPSTFVKREIVSLGIQENKIFVIPFGVEVKNSHIKVFKKNYQKQGIDFCFAGTINKRKGIEFLLKAWQYKVFQNDRLHLCGRLYPEIERIIKENYLENIITPGFVDTKEYFKKCDVYVFPSLLEGSSKSIYEAMNMSLPCITTPNSGSVITDNEDGFIIDVANEKQILEKMLLFKRNNKLIEEMGKKAYNNVQQYSWSNYAINIIKIYQKIIK